MKLDSYYVSLLSEQNKAATGMTPAAIYKALITASKSNRNAKKTMNYSSLIYIAGK